MADTSQHLEFMKLALEEAQKCTPTPTAFCVGCVLVARPPRSHNEPVVLAKGYSRELPGNTHAEANAIHKAQSLSQESLKILFGTEQDQQIDSIFTHTDVYTTMEPCSIRTSGLAPCCDLLISTKIKRCYIGVSEPDDFVKCEGAQKLKEAGVTVIWVDGLQDECIRVARTGTLIQLSSIIK